MNIETQNTNINYKHYLDDILLCIIGQPGTPGQLGTPGTPGTPGLPGSYPSPPKPNPSYPKPSTQPSYQGQNIYPTGYPQSPSVPDYGAQQPTVYPGYINSGYPVPPPPNGPVPNYPQPGSPSGYPQFYELYNGQNQVYPGQPEFPLYPAPVNPTYPYNANIYPQPQPSYPTVENKPKKPQVTTPVPSTIATQTSNYGKADLTTTEETSSFIDIRVKYAPDQPDTDYGQKAVVLGKQDLLSPSSGSSGYSSSLTPQYVNSPAKVSTKTPGQVRKDSNLVVFTPNKIDSSTPLYGVSTNEVPQRGIGSPVTPSNALSFEDQFTTLSPDSSTPVNIIPYPLPIVPNPGSCPCYFVPPTGNSTNQQPPQQPSFDLNSLPEGAVIGFVPVVFYPSCGGASASKEVLTSKLEPVFPSAYQVPYKCSYCEHSESQTATIRNSFDKVVEQSNLNPSIVVKSPSRKNYPNAPNFDQGEFGRRIKVVRRKTKDEQN